MITKVEAKAMIDGIESGAIYTGKTIGKWVVRGKP